MNNKFLPLKIILALIILICLGTVGITAYSLTIKKYPSPAIQPTIEPEEKYKGLSLELIDLMLKDIIRDQEACEGKQAVIKDYDFDAESVDLNNDNKKEIIVMANQICDDYLFGPRGGQPIYVYQKIDEKWMKIAGGGIDDNNFMFGEYEISNKERNGYKDIIVRNNNGGGFYSSNLYEWNKPALNYKIISSTTLNNDAQIDESGKVYDENDLDVWNNYANYKYGFSMKYPLDENINSEDFTEFQVQPYSINFDNFIIKAWDNSEYLKLDQFLASELFCAANNLLCESYADKKEAPLKNIKIGNNAWIEAGNNSQRFFIPNQSGHYIIEFELNKADYKNKFDQILSTFEFIGEQESE